MDITQQKETNDDEEATSVKVRSFCRNFYNLFRLVRLLSILDRMSCNFCPLLPPFRTKSSLSSHRTAGRKS